MSNTTKPLTAEEIRKEFFVVQDVIQQAKLWSNKREEVMFSLCAMRDAAFQTAAKDAEIAQLREELEGTKKLADRWLNGQADAQLRCDDLAKFQAQRNEAVNLLQSVGGYFMREQVKGRSNVTQDTFIEKIDALESRLTSQGTPEPESPCPDCVAVGGSPSGINREGIEMVCSLCGGIGTIPAPPSTDKQ